MLIQYAEYVLYHKNIPSGHPYIECGKHLSSHLYNQK